MKKTTFLIVLIFLSFNAFSQKNLEFNSVIKFNADVENGTQTSILTVPSGKIWKITSATIGDSFNSAYAKIDGHLVSIINTDNTKYSNLNPFPLWLPEGSYTIETRSSGNVTGITFSYSGIEFNVIE
ncbi:hypothetical protein [Psychroflexus lacisalsi]|jgi:hypothetical protein|uniref:Uncharacterized protein n=1 Tax=Psychroflexus lacisalsi TaxID=503928 RepID=A0ABN1K0B1_9FLAO|nr:hypothetical protein [Psychroflexus lacisalsi]MBZ9620969.1 hypothetical protein [Psychroflexus lacisalsi]